MKSIPAMIRCNFRRNYSSKHFGRVFEISDLPVTFRIMNKFFLIITFMAMAMTHLAQVADSTSIIISGKVRDEYDNPVSNVIIVNKRTKSGSFGKADGSFSIQCAKSDTVTITSLGYHSRDLCYVDSVLKPGYQVKLFLDTRIYVLPDVTVFAPRDLERIQEDINRLGYNEEDYMLSGINAAASPITFLYQQFSRKEQSKRAVAMMVNEDRKRELLKELFHHYVDYDIIQLDDEEFDAFIDYLNVSDEFMKTSTQYDFLIYVRDRFRDYKLLRRQQQKLKESDYDYDKD